MYWPEFKTDFLSSMILSFKKRSKALKYHSKQIKCERVSERENGKIREKLEIEIERGVGYRIFVVTLFAWEDRWIWVDVRQEQKGGISWEEDFEGRLLGTFSGKDVVNAFERTLALEYEMNKDSTFKFRTLWQHMVAQGPKILN